MPIDIITAPIPEKKPVRRKITLEIEEVLNSLEQGQCFAIQAPITESGVKNVARRLGMKIQIASLDSVPHCWRV